ncbi:AI-2E family transporter [Scleromatobacter humisilvae]|uniref:AI-2E family transporter n=1 Tax=Scleromatobacter humisilvae TaxID=2897159 RepID=A0A9X1YHK8_9BURK|nr:AI-2E family transporter [Scleromatobacter humisilvae]MCK9686258.1 AI-2E family transporter [Scleromatobacter humisilvae]
MSAVHVIPSGDETLELPVQVAGDGDEPPREKERVLLHMPIDVRNMSMIVIASLLGLYALRWAAEIVIPVLMGLLFSYALTPLVNGLVRVGVPRALGAAVVMIALVGGIGWGAWSLDDQANNLIESLPDAAQKLRDTLHPARRDPTPSTMDTVQKAAATLAQATDSTAKSTPGVAKVQIVKPSFNIQDYLFTGTMRAAEAAAQVLVVAFITYFLLAAGDTFRRKLARIAGPNFAKRKITVQALDEITEQIQRYLLVQLLTSVVVGIATALAFWALGFNNAAVWGVLAGVMNLIPYVGTALICGSSAIVALLQFGTLHMAVAVGSVSIVLHVVSGYMITPWLTSRTSRLNAVVVFIGVLAWGWLWGVWGLLLGTPILMALKAICDRVDDLKAIGELLGGSDKSGENGSGTVAS